MLKIITITGSENVEIIQDLYFEYQEKIGVDLCIHDFNEEVKNLPGKYILPYRINPMGGSHFMKKEL